MVFFGKIIVVNALERAPQPPLDPHAGDEALHASRSR
jgi:hypothetical protein